MKHFRTVFAAGSVLAIATSCAYDLCYYSTRIMNYFVPAEKLCTSLETVQARNVRKIPVRRDGLMTDEIARVLYRSNEVVELHERLGQECAGVKEHDAEKKIQEQQEQNREQARFFVSLYGTRKEWSFTVCKDGHLYKASEVRHRDLDQSYKDIFGMGAFRYLQNIYEVTFDIALAPPFDFILCNGKNKAHATWE